MVDYAYYKTVYGGDLDNASFLFYSDRAEREIRAACFGRIGDDLTDFQKDCVKRAICYETDYIAAYGDAFSSPMSIIQIGSTSLEFGGSDGKPVSRVSSDAAQLLEWSGLACRIVR